MKIKRENQLKLGLFSVLIGAFAGLVIWCFLKIMTVGMELIWTELPEQLNIPFYTVIVCTVGGLIIGLFRKKFGDYPEELGVVLGKVKNDKAYDYKNMAVMLVAALLPLLFGSSVGPEAGLTGIIVGLCYWAGDNLKAAHIDAKEYSKMGMAVTLSVMFHSPLFGLFTVEEESESDVSSIGKGSKLYIYGLALAGGAAVYMILSDIFGNAMEGFPSFETVAPHGMDYVMVIVYILCGLVLAKVYEVTHEKSAVLAGKLPAVLRETIGGLFLGIIGMLVPAMRFSGEHQMGELMTEYGKYLPIALIGAAFLKIILTNTCIQFGLRGGHFFPVIFAGVLLGYGVAMIAFPGGGHEIFAAAVVTAATLGGTMKKPLAVTMLLFICFPVRLAVWIFVGAAVAGKLMGRREKD